jgi:hypothetical protein
MIAAASLDSIDRSNSPCGKFKSLRKQLQIERGLPIPVVIVN